jgi:hypothetical protein
VGYIFQSRLLWSRRSGRSRSSRQSQLGPDPRSPAHRGHLRLPDHQVWRLLRAPKKSSKNSPKESSKNSSNKISERQFEKKFERKFEKMSEKQFDKRSNVFKKKKKFKQSPT